MKLLLAFLFSTLFSLHLAAQLYQYVPLPTEDGFWNVDFGGDPKNCTGPYMMCGQIAYVTIGDTVINGQTYSMIYEESAPPTQPSFMFREDTSAKEVYALFPSDTFPYSLQEYLVYDFGAEIGDSILLPEALLGLVDNYIHIVEVDSIELGGVLRRRLHTGFGVKWIEGVGGDNGPFHPYLMLEYWSALRCFSADSELIYSEPINGPINWVFDWWPWYQYCDSTLVGIEEDLKENPVEVYNDPVQEIVRFNFGQDPVQISVYNIQGKLVSRASDPTRKFELNYGDWMAGMYLIEAWTENQVGEQIPAYSKLIKR